MTDTARKDAQLVFETQRLRVCLATPAEVPLIHALWTDPAVMRQVGFPEGLKITVEEIERSREKMEHSVLTALLIACDKETGEPVGQCRLGSLDEDGVCEPDIKLQPAMWGRGCGRELWKGLVDTAFALSDARVVRGTPNRENVPSIRMQEAAGMIRVGEGVFEAGDATRQPTCPVPYYVYETDRATWTRARDDKT